MGQQIIPHSKPTLGVEEIEAVSEVIRSGYIAQGDKAREFEKELARFIGVKGAVVTNSGTSALHLGLIAMGIGEGDEALLPSYVCSAPLNTIYQVRARPVLCDIELESFNISLESIRNKMTDRTKAVIVPHMFGSPADLERIGETGVPVIEDCAHSIGARFGDSRTGSIGRISMLSFYANKMLACGEGGALLSNDEEILQKARDLRDYDEKEDYKVRYNYKMTDMQAAVGLIQLKKLPELIRSRKETAKRYDKAFKDADIILPRGEFDHIYYRYVVRIKKDLGEAISFMKEKGVMCEKPVFNPLHRYFEMRSGFRNADEAYSTALSIPIYPSLTEEELERIIRAVSSIL